MRKRVLVLGNGLMGKSLAGLLSGGYAKGHRLAGFTGIRYLRAYRPSLATDYDVVVDCSGGTECVGAIAKAVEHEPSMLWRTINTEMHVDIPGCGMDLRTVVTPLELPGDQPVVLINLAKYARSMGMQVVGYVIYKGFMDRNPRQPDMDKWSKITGNSHYRTVTLTDGTKLAYELAFIANAIDEYPHCESDRPIAIVDSQDDIGAVGSAFMSEYKRHGRPVVGWVLCPNNTGSVAVVVRKERGMEMLGYLKVGGDDAAVLLRGFHLCQYEAIAGLQDDSLCAAPTHNRFGVGCRMKACAAAGSSLTGYTQDGRGIPGVYGSVVPASRLEQGSDKSALQYCRSGGRILAAAALADELVLNRDVVE